MSDFTTQLRFICESYAGRTAEGSVVSDIDTIIANSRSKIFDFDYPIFDETYKPDLESKIINHFYTQEIGQETVGLFKHRLKTKMREIMPYYNQLYLSERLKFDPFINADYMDAHNQTSIGTDNFSSHNTAGFENDTGRNVVESHNEHSVTNYSEDNDNKINKESTDTLSGSDSTTESGSVEVAKSGKESNELSFGNRKDSNLHKEADTPLGDIGDVDGSSADALAGNSGYLSKVAQDINKKSGSETNELSYENRKDTTTYNNHKNKTDYGKVDTFESEENQDLHKEGTSATDSNGGSQTADTTHATGNSSSDTNDLRNTKDKQDYFGKVFGKVGSETYSEMLMKFRDTFLNIDMMVIKELEPLFMLLW